MRHIVLQNHCSIGRLFVFEYMYELLIKQFSREEAQIKLPQRNSKKLNRCLIIDYLFFLATLSLMKQHKIEDFFAYINPC